MFAVHYKLVLGTVVKVRASCSASLVLFILDEVGI